MSEKEEKEQETTVDKTAFALREEAVLTLWNTERTFEASLAKDSPQGDFVFYDGPPFATGLPHHGHILQSAIKDTIPRYKTMRGFHVRRRWGWDCHGLPLENIIEAKLGIKTKRDIEELGVGTFNAAAREAVLEYADDWKKIIPRIGRWVDMEDDYKTMDASYTESVWWSFAELNRKGLIYEGFKSMHLCPRCGTTLSNFEVGQGYADIKDIAVTVKLELEDEPGTYLLAWTTTPWTLPGNMAAAVHREYDYVKVRGTYGDVHVHPDTKEVSLHNQTFETVILAKSRLVFLETIFTTYEIIAEFKGSELIGKSYIPPFDYYTDRDIVDKKNAWKIYHADYVTLDSGTGIVHLAPAYGEEDMALAREEHIPVVHHVNLDGRFADFVSDFAGLSVKPKDDASRGISHLEADIAIVRKLAEKGLLFKKENITHSYPHCWRCDTPLLNYATTSWFVKATALKDQLVAENQKIQWVPAHVGESRFGNWLENVRDWSVSRQRYWGAPIPVWKNPKTDERVVIGSLADLLKYTKRSGNTYTLMRHGEAQSNADGISSTHIEAINPLTEKGKAQVSASVATVKEHDIDTIIASPFGRTRETAEMLALALGIPVSDIMFDERLGEIQFGELDGVSMDEYHTFLEQAKEWATYTPDGGESWNEVKTRAGAVLYELEKKYQNKNILIVAHNSPLRMLHAVAQGETLDKKFDNDDAGTFFGNTEVRTLDFVPLPHNEVFELEYHRPFIDAVELVADDGAKLVRVSDVFDCWYESGSMAYAQDHYPFENKDIFNPEKSIGFPADFIAEAVDQTRGWFYSMIVLGVGLFGMSPYKNVITTGLLLAEDGKKMSKKLKNYPDPMDVVAQYGADTLRFFLLSSPLVKGEDFNFSEKNVAELSRKNIGRLDNVLSFYELYKDSTPHSFADSRSENILDRWILARLAELVYETTLGYEGYELDRATKPITDFIDDLSTWYLRRSRDRMKVVSYQTDSIAPSDGSGEGARKDTREALQTTRFVLRELSKIMAPVMPFYADYLYRRVRDERNDPTSVHLDVWPEHVDIDQVVLRSMQEVRRIVSLALEKRTQENIKVRQPLAVLSIRENENVPKTEEYVSLIREEVHVKRVEFVANLPEEVLLDIVITDELRAEGAMRDLMRAVQVLRKEADLVPQDMITLTIETNDLGERLVREFDADIRKIVGALEILFGKTEGTTIGIDALSFVLSIAKADKN